MRTTFVFLACFVFSLFTFAQSTRTWQQTSFEDFEKGTSKGVAITSNGALELAPQFRQLAITPSSYIWSMGADNDGNVFAAAGSPARVYRIAPNGTTTVVLEPQELQVQALTVAPNGVVYAATSPDGRVYRIERKAGTPARSKKKAEAAANAETPQKTGAKGTPQTGITGETIFEERPRTLPTDPDYNSSVYFEPKTKYIWSLALDTAGNLFVATGDRGEIYKVDANTHQGSVFFKSDEAHIRVLAFGPKGNLYAGSDGSGLIYSITPAGEGFVLYSAPKKEITALAIDDLTGNIYAAGVGEKRAEHPAPPVTITLTAPGTHPNAPNAPGAAQQSAPSAASLGGSEIYQIAPDGSPRRLWTSRDDLVYALGFDNSGHLIAGTGNKGRIFSILGEDNYVDLLRASATQVTAFTKGTNGMRYVGSSNLGKIFSFGPGPETEGSYISDVYDARNFSRWGRAEIRGVGSYQLSARSGNVDNPDRNWSPWRAVNLERDLPLDVPPARFIQWKAVLVSGRPAPRIESVGINYLPKNIAPHVEDVVVQVGYKYSQQPRTLSEQSAVASTSANTSSNSPGNPVRDRDWIAVRWNARDDNDDSLAYSVYYRGDNETRWKLLRDRLTDRFFSFESDLLPDGGYTIRVVATDAPSHTPEEALTDEQESSRFQVDNTPPQIADLSAINEGNTLHVTFRAQDNASNIRRAEFSLDAGDWQLVEPVGQISDAKLENYDFNIPLHDHVQTEEPEQRQGRGRRSRGSNNVQPQLAIAPAPEHLIVVRVWDGYDNMSTAKVIARPAPTAKQ
jgi:sugar lactone lactonase YvrE